MSGFSSSPAPPATPDGQTLSCGPFWPDIDINDFRNAMRIGGTAIPDDRVSDALLGAVISVDRDLSLWRASREADGNATLVSVSDVQIGGENRLALIFRRAVYAYAAADLLETHRDVTATGTGQSRAPEMDMRADDHRRNAVHAIRDIKGLGRTTVELI